MSQELQGLIAGLGNPGDKYQDTRHNLGFLVLDRLLETQGAGAIRLSPRGDDCLLWRWTPREAPGPWLLVKPLTFMNLSGRAVGRILRYYKLAPGAVLAVHDEMDLPLGRMKLKFGGGAAGHNGIASLIQEIGTKDFHRLRMGVGRPRERDAVGHVLSRFSPEERETLGTVVAKAAEGLGIYAARGARFAMQEINGFDAVNNQIEA